jgi:hypothetical protein
VDVNHGSNIGMWRHAPYNSKNIFYFKNKPFSHVEACLNFTSF